ncbi:MAG: PfkB family carbohydrate kinase [Fusobacteriaceae bacterium]|jgi:D-beta-D-heptose 7-phosphate kinase/D-beta-D-heptose 1-phosphate adenosyltransferase|nr:PfkB family carbohydrate kinase [Fusobacteriaceae bacterium]
MKTNSKFIEIIKNQFPLKKILVLGDIMVDKYTIGKVDRISPEAPIPIIEFEESKLTAGGASNVTNNLVSLGCKVMLSGTAAEDEYGDWVRKYMESKGIDVGGIISEEGRPTTLKERFATKSQQLFRVDRERNDVIKKETQDKIFSYLESVIKDLDAVLLSDYKKGVLSSYDFVQKIIALCNKNNVSVTIDSKSSTISAFKNATFVKPNNLELEQAVNIKIIDDETLNIAGNMYLKSSGAKYLIVTRGDKGISVFSNNEERKDFSSKALQVYDVTGAGDTVISTITLGIVSGLSLYDATVLGNLAASVVISKKGTATVNQEELINRIKEEKV